MTDNRNVVRRKEVRSEKQDLRQIFSLWVSNVIHQFGKKPTFVNNSYACLFEKRQYVLKQPFIKI